MEEEEIINDRIKDFFCYPPGVSPSLSKIRIIFSVPLNSDYAEFFVLEFHLAFDGISDVCAFSVW